MFVVVVLEMNEKHSEKGKHVEMKLLRMRTRGQSSGMVGKARALPAADSGWAPPAENKPCRRLSVLSPRTNESRLGSCTKVTRLTYDWDHSSI